MYEMQKNLLDSRIHTLLQIKIALARLGFHFERQMMKLQKVKKCHATRGGGGGSAAVSPNDTGGRGGLK
jgi:hypothetical protein